MKLTTRIFSLLSLVCLLGLPEDKEYKESSDELSSTTKLLHSIGMPIVTSYYAMKDSSLLAERNQDAKGLEALADFFLTPTHFMLGGQTLQTLEDGTVKTTSSFSYNDGFGWKAATSTLLLPLSIAIGTPIKALSRLNSKEKTTPSLSAKIEEYKIERLFTEESPTGLQKIPRHTPLSTKQKIEVEALKEIASLFEEAKIPYWANCGTCLGVYRHEGMIPWDFDIDLAVLTPDHDQIKELLKSRLNPEKYICQDWSSFLYPKTFIKVYCKESKSHIDIFHFNPDPQNRLLRYIFTFTDSPFPDAWKRGEQRLAAKEWPYQLIFPLRRAYFDKVPIRVPNQIEEYLKLQFGDLSPSMAWDPKLQKYRKKDNHTYWKS